MSQFMTQILEHLAEMFPKQDYQSRLEHYIISRKPQSVADIEIWEREFTQVNSRGFLS